MEKSKPLLSYFVEMDLVLENIVLEFIAQMQGMALSKWLGKGVVYIIWRLWCPREDMIVSELYTTLASVNPEIFFWISCPFLRITYW